MNSKNTKHFTHVEIAFIIFIYFFIDLCSTEGGQVCYFNVYTVICDSLRLENMEKLSFLLYKSYM